MSYNSCNDLGIPWCSVIYSFLALSFLLLILTIIQYTLIYKESRIMNYSKNLVFAAQFLQLFSMCLHYAFVGDDFNIIFLLQEYFLNVQYSLVFYYFLIQLSENMRSLRQVKIPLIILNGLMLIGFIVFLAVYIALDLDIYSCNSIIWVYLHGCGIVLSSIFIYLGYHAGKNLKVIAQNYNIVVNNNKLKHFWVIIASMSIASIVNICESVYFIDISNHDCFNSYSDDEYLDIAVFILIRVFSHYLFLVSCLYIFKNERKKSIYSEINSESEKSLPNPFEEPSAWVFSPTTTQLDAILECSQNSNQGSYK
ncbi:hypothetical protein SteCoe_20100 [Stentor coeruleus]|uniref:THH1/TOM1/TOM3 domain-containing protein n=1 Tax=Stentor coeruleus TaxID=5963 RepID=A0A1R2BSL8_9CILI|nr:hypothetical protein SteCoe_20100 [Stentor coeruleus]